MGRIMWFPRLMKCSNWNFQTWKNIFKISFAKEIFRIHWDILEILKWMLQTFWNVFSVIHAIVWKWMWLDGAYMIKWDFYTNVFFYYFLARLKCLLKYCKRVLRAFVKVKHFHCFSLKVLKLKEWRNMIKNSMIHIQNCFLKDNINVGLN